MRSHLVNFPTEGLIWRREKDWNKNGTKEIGKHFKEIQKRSFSPNSARSPSSVSRREKEYCRPSSQDKHQLKPPSPNFLTLLKRNTSPLGEESAKWNHFHTSKEVRNSIKATPIKQPSIKDRVGEVQKWMKPKDLLIDIKSGGWQGYGRFEELYSKLTQNEPKLGKTHSRDCLSLRKLVVAILKEQFSLHEPRASSL